MDSGDYEKTEMELRRDARVAELALQLQPIEAAIQASAKEFGTSIAKRKSVKEQCTQVPALPTRKSARVSNKDLEAINEDESAEDSHSTGEGNEDNQSKEDDGRIYREASGSRKRHQRSGVSLPLLEGGLKRQPMQFSLGGQWQWVPPPPSEPPEWAMVQSHVPPYSALWQGRMESQEVVSPSDSGGRSTRRKRQIEYEKKAEERSNNGRKPNELHVKPNGEIDASSSGKTTWDRTMRAFVPLILDMSVIDWDKHKPQTLKKLRDTMDLEFEYVPQPLSSKGFCTAVQKFLKGERCRLKKLSDPEKDDDYPVKIDPEQWKRLKEYWVRGDQVKKSEFMSNVRKQVYNVSKRGRRGKAGEEADVVKDRERSPRLSELAEGLQVSGSSVVSSGLHAKVATLESRQDEFEKFRVEVLASTDRNTKAVEALQATLMTFLQKGSILEGEKEVLTTTTTSPSLAIDPTGPSTVVKPMEDMNFFDDPYELAMHQSLEPINNPSLEPTREQLLLQDEDNDSTQMNSQKIDEPFTKGNEVEGDAGVDVIVLDNPSTIDQVPKNPSKDKEFSMQLRKGKDQEKPAAKKEILRIKVHSTRSRKVECSTQSQQMESPQKKKFTIGQEVSLVNPSAPKQVVASATITAIGGESGPQLYHGQPIPKGWCRLDIAHAPGGFVDLMHPNPAGDEFKLKDVVGATTIWDEEFLVIIPRVGRPIPSNSKGRIGGK